MMMTVIPCPRAICYLGMSLALAGFSTSSVPRYIKNFNAALKSSRVYAHYITANLLFAIKF